MFDLHFYFWIIRRFRLCVRNDGRDIIVTIVDLKWATYLASQTKRKWKKKDRGKNKETTKRNKKLPFRVFFQEGIFRR